MLKRWTLKQADEDKVRSLQTALNIHPVICRMLVQRGVETFEEARKFFRPSLDDLHDPFLMRDMDKAINRLTQAIAAGEKILVYGDYDVDGTTAVATVFSFFRFIHQHLDYYIPNRYTEGYGISTQAIDFAKREGFSLIIALDCGIKSADKIAYANTLGVDFIICDHHLPGEEIPNAIAVLDPKRTDCPYPYKELSGCGIGLKLIQAFAQQHGIPSEKIFQFLDLVCVSIGSDIVPITGENRILASHGLKKLNTAPTAGLAKLKEVSGVTKEMSIDDVVFILGPRINAAGRMEDAKHAVKLLIAESLDTSGLQEAFALNKFNTERKEADRSITAHALQMIAADESLIHRNTTVLCHPDWNKGVIGIVASRLTETYYRPTIVLTESDGKLAGSARSVKGFDLYEAIYECRDLLIQFGGHRAAAGMTMHAENFNAFAQKFEEVVSARITPAQLIPELDIDAELPLADITPALFNIVQQMAPFGPDNMKPLFITTAVKDSGYSRIVKEDHLRFDITQGRARITGIGFGLAAKSSALTQPTFDICYQLSENEFQGRVSLQLMVKDVR